MKSSRRPKSLRALRNQRGSNLIDLGVGVFLLTILALLAGNIYIMLIAKGYNDRACKEAVIFAARAAVEGKDQYGVIRSAQNGLNQCGAGGFFIEHPQFTIFQDDKVLGVRTLRVQTKTTVRPPAPFLVIDPQVEKEGKITLTSTYVLELGGKTGN